MDKHTLNKYIAMMLVAIGRAGTPNSYVWMAVDPNMQDLNTYNTILGALCKSGIIVNTGHFLTLTEKGKVMLGRIEEIYK